MAITAEELLAHHPPQRCELIEGRLRLMEPSGAQHGEIAVNVGALVLAHAREHGGRAFGAETGFILARGPDTVRAPDAAYVATTDAPTRGFWPGAPDLAAEVVSPGDTFSEVHEKALHWLGAGTAVVLVVDPDGRTVTRYRAADDVVVLSGDDLVDCAPAMPGFAPSVAALLGPLPSTAPAPD